jgi:hypothetical protein
MKAPKNQQDLNAKINLKTIFPTPTITRKLEIEFPAKNPFTRQNKLFIE